MKEKPHSPPTAVNADTNSQSQSFIDQSELLRRLPISRRTATNWIRQGKLPAVKINRRILFHWPSVETALVRLQRTTPAGLEAAN